MKYFENLNYYMIWSMGFCFFFVYDKEFLFIYLLYIDLSKIKLLKKYVYVCKYKFDNY